MRHTSTPSVSTAEISAADVLELLGRELTTLSSSAEDLQTSLSSLVHKEVIDLRGSSAQIQRLDLLTQTLAALADFSRQVASSEPINCMVKYEEICSQLPLEALSKRLMNGGSEDPGFTSSANSTGECELF